MARIEVDLGPVDAYAIAVAEGYTGTREEWVQAMANAEANGLKAEGYAVGKQNGTPVTSGEYFENNAKYYNEQAQSAKEDAETAQTAAETAKTAAETAQTAAETAATRDTAAWLNEHITNPDSPPLDRTLMSSSAAAPADMVGELKSAIGYTRNETLCIDEEGKTWLKGEFIVGSLNNSGEITTNAHRIVTKDILNYNRDIQVGMKAGYQLLYVEYPTEGSPSLTIKTTSFNISRNTNFRIGVMAIPTEPENADINAFIDAITVNSKIYEMIANADDEIADINEEIELIKSNEKDITSEIDYITGDYISKSGSIEPSAGYAISELIPLSAGKTIMLTGANAAVSNVVSILSVWDSTGTTFIENLYTGTGDTYEDVTHLAKENEYLKICYSVFRTTPNVKIKEPNGESAFEEAYKIKEATMNLFPDVSMFDDIAVCGDSYTAGSIFYNGTLIGDNAKTRWGTVLGRLTGASVITYASGGADTNTWQSRSDCLPKLLSDDPYELYVLCLGINDMTYVTKGTTADMNHAGTPADPYPNTFYGNYASIISQIKAHAPKAKIVISKVFIVTYQNGIYYDWSSEAIEDIASKFSIPYIETADADFFSSNWFDSNMDGGHPIAATYSGIAKAMRYLLSKSILDNTTYYNDYYPD